MISNNTIERIKKLTDRQMEDPRENKYTLYANASEEMGEIATAMGIEDGIKKKKLDEPAYMESLDAAICTLALYVANGGDIDMIDGRINQKLDKWEKKYFPVTTDVDQLELDLIGGNHA